MYSQLTYRKTICVLFCSIYGQLPEPEAETIQTLHGQLHMPRTCLHQAILCMTVQRLLNAATLCLWDK